MRWHVWTPSNLSGIKQTTNKQTNNGCSGRQNKQSTPTRTFFLSILTMTSTTNTTNNQCCDIATAASFALPIIFEFLPAFDLIQANYVCKEWNTQLETNINLKVLFHGRLVMESWPYATFASSVINELSISFKDLFVLRNNLIRHKLPNIWYGTDFRQSCRFGKYSRWVLSSPFDDPSFIVNLAWAVRMIYCLSPKGYQTLDGADTTTYDPLHSTRAGDSPGWNLVRLPVEYESNIKPQLLFDLKQCVGLWFLDCVVRDRAPRRSTQDLINEAVEKYPILKDHPGWKRAVELAEHTKLLNFLLCNRLSLESLFWDVNGVVCRGVHRLAAGDFIWNGFDEFGSPKTRQFPHIFNMVKLGQHVESNITWD